MKKLIPLLLLSFFLIQCAAPKRTYKRFYEPYEGKSIRVLLDENFSGRISFHVPVNIFSEEKENLKLLRADEEITVRRKGEEVELRAGGRSYVSRSIEIEPDLYEDLLSYRDKQYRGGFRIVSSAGKLYLINVLETDDYLKSVLFAEMGVASKPEEFEALKAFAVCARNYTVMKMNENARHAFDVYADKRDQVYAGFSGEKPYTSRAINQTKNLVLVYKGMPAKTFYFSSCGGFTENCDNVFNHKGLEYLQGVQDGRDSYCSISPSFSWEENYTAAEIIRMLREAKFIESEDYRIRNISVKSRFSSGRVNELEIRLENPDGEKTIVLTGNPIRYTIRSKVKNGLLKSIMFQVETQKKRGYAENIKITGKGNGHGVGFCQWGSIGQSRRGQSYQEILVSYFPGTTLEKL